ncbi:MAG: condensation domain-containing protein, partial [Acidobacteriota bacterium]
MKELRLDMFAPYAQRQVDLAREVVESTSDDVYVMPTSVAQQRFWLLDQLEPGNTALNMPLALSLTGKVNVDELERALNEVVSRHEVLRTTFSRNNGKPVQVIAAKQTLPLEFVDLSGHIDKESESERIRVEEAHHTLDLLRGPLFKARLIRLEAEDHILLLTLHHIICDGWSNGVLVREVGEIYDAYSQGRPSPHEELPIQYADFAAWQQEWLKSDGFEDQLAYWKQQLGNEIPTLDIPTDFPRSKNRASFGDIESLLLPQPLTRAIRTLSQREDATPFMIFLTAFNVLLHRYSGQDNIIVGSPTANRQRSETEGLIGTFANTLLLRTDASGEPTFIELLRRVKDASLGAFSNQTLPF